MGNVRERSRRDDTSRWAGTQSASSEFLDCYPSPDLVPRIRVCNRSIRLRGCRIDQERFCQVDRLYAAMAGVQCVDARGWNNNWRLLGIRDSWLGRLLGMGSGRKFIADSLVVLCGCSTHYTGQQTDKELSENKFYPDHNEFCPCSL